MEIRMITKAEADDIIATREPRGLFYLDTGKSFVGIATTAPAMLGRRSSILCRSAEHGCFRSRMKGLQPVHIS